MISFLSLILALGQTGGGDLDRDKSHSASQDELQIRAVCSSQTLSARHKPLEMMLARKLSARAAICCLSLSLSLAHTAWPVPVAQGHPASLCHPNRTCPLHAFPNPQSWHRALPLSLTGFPPLQFCFPQRGSLLFPEIHGWFSSSCTAPEDTWVLYPTVSFCHWNFHLPWHLILY